MHCLVLSCLLLTSFYTTTYVEATVELVVVRGISEQCSDSRVTLQCTLSGDTLTWNTPHGALNFVRGRPGDTNTEFYQSHFEQLNSTHLTSTLSFTYTSQITINCSVGVIHGTITLTTEGPPSAPERPLTSLERIERVNKTFSSVSVVWNIPTTNNVHISSYVVTVDPPISLPADGVIAADNPLFNSRQLTLTLQHGRQYNIRVRAKSCNDRVDGATSNPLTINVQVPPAVMRCTALPVYDYNSNSLTRIEIEWDPVDDTGEDITTSITANVQNYIISAVPIGIVEPAINDTLGSSDSSVCSNTQCVHSFQNTGEMFSLYYSIYVTAKNLLSDGYSETRLCSNTTISPRNDLLAVDVRRNFTDVVEVLCRPLSRYEGRASCEVVYSVLPDGDTYTEESDSVGGAEDIISVFLTNTEPDMDISMAVSTRGGKQDVVLEGTFETGDIVSSEENLKYFLCPKPSPTSDGSTFPTTEIHTIRAESKSSACPVTPWILAGGIFIISLPIGIITGIAVMLFYNSKRKKTQPSNMQASYYEYISPKDIAMASNSCYTLSGAPKLPEPRKTDL